MTSRAGVHVYAVTKRVIDVVVACLGLFVTAPLCAAVAVRIRREDRGPVIYNAPRVGMGGVDFQMKKFRTMVVNADQLGGPSTADDDPRLTQTGRLLRRWKLDEIPQLWNVLRGEMSLVGPRPQVRVEVKRYTDHERALLSVKPGLTDWASIRFNNEGAILRGHPDPDRAYDELIRAEKVRLGLEYVERRGLAVDLRILGRTALSIVGVRQ